MPCRAFISKFFGVQRLPNYGEISRQTHVLKSLYSEARRIFIVTCIFFLALVNTAFFSSPEISKLREWILFIAWLKCILSFPLCLVFIALLRIALHGRSLKKWFSVLRLWLTWLHCIRISSYGNDSSQQTNTQKQRQCHLRPQTRSHVQTKKKTYRGIIKQCLLSICRKQKPKIDMHNTHNGIRDGTANKPAQEINTTNRICI